MSYVVYHNAKVSKFPIGSRDLLGWSFKMKKSALISYSTPFAQDEGNKDNTSLWGY